MNTRLDIRNFGRFPRFGDVPALSADRILDTYPAFAAYSVRLLSGTYAGACMRVRRASDNAEQDIGFDGDWLDEAAIATFCGVSTGYVVKWYDQSGNTKDISHATATNQPQIYDGSAVTEENGKPSLIFASSSYLTITDSSFKVAEPSLFLVKKFTGGNGLVAFGSSSNLGVSIWTGLFIGGDGTNDYYINNTFTQLVTQSVFSAIFTGDAGPVYENGVLKTSYEKTTTLSYAGVNDVFSVGARNDNPPSSPFSGEIQELIMYASDQSADRADISIDQNTAFGVY